VTDLVVSFRVAGAPRWLRLPGPVGLKAFAAEPIPAPDDGEIHVTYASASPLEPLRPGVHTTIAVVRAWSGDGLPPAVAGTAAERSEREGTRRSAFSRELTTLLRQAAAGGLIARHQAAALSRAARLAMVGTGPAGRRRDSQETRILGS
jgi:ornithine cyclodeaminase/alanine dehydrogenase-like protein (mu-crystallin family)